MFSASSPDFLALADLLASIARELSPDEVQTYFVKDALNEHDTCQNDANR